ncbi:hypothetical protein [uncultured Kordia sp.]|uniref:hypothetical protein n=1 Tax=uncultured Kordia sp. TaxID=507699 RepID=UPI002626718D|nr:hypothetical protein [uncultured Kordia sp.]
MRYLFLLIFPFLLNAQATDLSALNSLQENEQVIIDITVGSCFYGETQKIIITKKKESYEYVYIEDVYKILFKIVEKHILLRRKKVEKWIVENTETLKKHGKRNLLTEAQYQSKINILEEVMQYNKNCTSIFEGDYSRIKINSTNLQLNERFSCKLVENFIKMIPHKN